MKLFVQLLLLFLCFNVCELSFAQRNTLYDDSRVSSVYIEIPVDSLHILYEDVLANHYYMVRFIFDDNDYKDTLENVGFRLRGNTSRYSQKKSFKISFNEYVPGRKYQGVKKLNLNGEHNDPTMIREKLFYDLWKKQGFPERRTTFVKVYINHSYYGLYTNLEEMDKEWLKQVYEDEDGNLYKCTYPADLVYLGSDQQVYKDIMNGEDRAYDLQTNKTADDYTGLVGLITMLNMEAGAAFADSIQKHLNVKEFLKAYAYDVASGNWDDYAYNKNNYYLYDNPANKQYDFIAYDTDNTFGVDWMGQDWATRNCLHWEYPGGSRPLVTKLLAIPSYYNLYKSYLDSVSRFVIYPDSVFPRIDAMKALITPAAIEDNYRTLDYDYDMQDFDKGFTGTVDGHTPYGIKPFILARRQAISDQLYFSDVPQIDVKVFAIYPNPADDKIALRFANTMNGKVSCHVTDVFGNVVKEFTGNLAIGNLTLSVANLSSGYYIVQVITPGEKLIGKFIKK